MTRNSSHRTNYRAIAPSSHSANGRYHPYSRPQQMHKTQQGQQSVCGNMPPVYQPEDVPYHSQAVVHYDTGMLPAQIMPPPPLPTPSEEETRDDIMAKLRSVPYKALQEVPETLPEHLNSMEKARAAYDDSLQRQHRRWRAFEHLFWDIAIPPEDDQANRAILDRVAQHSDDEGYWPLGRSEWLYRHGPALGLHIPEEHPVVAELPPAVDMDRDRINALAAQCLHNPEAPLPSSSLQPPNSTAQDASDPYLESCGDFFDDNGMWPPSQPQPQTQPPNSSSQDSCDPDPQPFSSFFLDESHLTTRPPLPLPSSFDSTGYADWNCGSPIIPPLPPLEGADDLELQFSSDFVFDETMLDLSAPPAPQPAPDNFDWSADEVFSAEFQRQMDEILGPLEEGNGASSS